MSKRWNTPTGIGILQVKKEAGGGEMKLTKLELTIWRLLLEAAHGSQLSVQQRENRPNPCAECIQARHGQAPPAADDSKMLGRCGRFSLEQRRRPGLHQ